MSSQVETQNVQAAVTEKKTKRVAKPKTPKVEGDKKETTEKKKAVRKPKVAKVNKVEGEESKEPTEPAVKKVRQVVNSESVNQEFADLKVYVDSLVQNLSEAKKGGDKKAGNVGVRSLRTINKKIKDLQGHAKRVMNSTRKHKTRLTDRVKTSSGFSKKMSLTEEMKLFAGSRASELDCRQKVTRFLCDYIRDNNLQDPSKKTNILITKDPKLSAVLRYSEPVLNKTTGNTEIPPMTYTTLQRYIGRLLIKKEPVLTPTGETPSKVASVSTPTMNVTPALNVTPAVKVTKKVLSKKPVESLEN